MEDVVGLGEHGLTGLLRPLDMVAHASHEVGERSGDVAHALIPRLGCRLRGALLVR